MYCKRFKLRIPSLIALMVVFTLVAVLIDVARVVTGDLQSSPDGAWLLEGKPDIINVFVANALLKENGAWAKVSNGHFIKWHWLGPGRIDAVVSKGSLVKSWTEKSQDITFNITER
jgi:hypothetical protein